MSTQLPFNTGAMLALAPSEYGVGFKVYMMADRMYPCDLANILKTNKATPILERQRFLSDSLEESDVCSKGYLCGYQTGCKQQLRYLLLNHLWYIIP